MSTLFPLRRWAACLGLALGLPLTAHAVLVTGEWDPPFGAFLPNLAYRAIGSFQVPLACTNLADGIYSTVATPCAGSTITSLDLVFSNIVAGPGFNSGTFNLGDGNFGGLSQVRVEGGAVVGFGTTFSAGLLTFFGGLPPFSVPEAAEGNAFLFGLNPFGTTLICQDCRSSLANPIVPADPDIPASIVGLEQFLVTYTSTDISTPKFTDGNGNALGTRLDEQGRVIGQSTSISAPLTNTVPEPGALALALTALGLMAGIAARARRANAS